METTNKEILEEALRAIGGFLWLQNNLRNYDLPEFKTFLIAAMKDAEGTYWKLKEMLQEENG